MATAQDENQSENLARLKTLRDEIRVRIHLGTRDLKDEWDEIERELRTMGNQLQDLVSATEGKFDSLLGRLKRIHAGLKQSASTSEAGLVRDVMSKDVKSVRPSETLREAASRMWDADVGALPVIDDDHRVLGMITDRDACMAAYTQDRALSEIAVSSAMSQALYLCQAGDALDKAESIMAERQVRRLPVVDEEGRLVGIISLNDLARTAVAYTESNTRKQHEYDVAQTLAAVSKPHPQRIH